MASSTASSCNSNSRRTASTPPRSARGGRSIRRRSWRGMLREFVEWQVARPAPPVLIERAVDDHGLIVAPDRALQAVFLVPGLGFIAVLIVRGNYAVGGRLRGDGRQFGGAEAALEEDYRQAGTLDAL